MKYNKDSPGLLYIDLPKFKGKITLYYFIFFIIIYRYNLLPINYFLLIFTLTIYWKMLFGP